MAHYKDLKILDGVSTSIQNAALIVCMYNATNSILEDLAIKTLFLFDFVFILQAIKENLRIIHKLYQVL